MYGNSSLLFRVKASISIFKETKPLKRQRSFAQLESVGKEKIIQWSTLEKGETIIPSLCHPSIFETENITEHGFNKKIRWSYSPPFAVISCLLKSLSYSDYFFPSKDRNLSSLISSFCLVTIRAISLNFHKSYFIKETGDVNSDPILAILYIAITTNLVTQQIGRVFGSTMLQKFSPKCSPCSW